MIQAKIVEGTSKKTGNKYIAVELTFPNGYKKLVFPQNSAEAFVFNYSLK